MRKIQMVDLAAQYERIRPQVEQKLIEIAASGWYVKSPEVTKFEADLAEYLSVKHVISCANGTDALQIALMALDLKPGDEVITPAFTYAATVEVIVLLGLSPVYVEVDPDTFTVSPESIKAAITSNTKAMMPVHLFGQCADMEEILEIAKAHDIAVIEDNAQAIGAHYSYADGRKVSGGAMGDIGTTSFYPSKNLGCMGDGGAIFTNSDELGEKLRMLANHGQKTTYYHDMIGVNSRLDSLQAGVLNIKLAHLDQYAQARQELAAKYDEALKDIPGLSIPERNASSTHVFHQYTIKVDSGRDELKAFLNEHGIPANVYYPLPLHLQKGYLNDRYPAGSLPISEKLCEQVLSIPMHTEMDADQFEYIISHIKQFFNQ